MKSSLRLRLFALTLLALLPATILTIVGYVNNREQLVDSYRQRLTEMVATAAAAHNNTLDDAEQLLTALSHVPVVHEIMSNDCDAFMAEMLRSFPVYINLGVIDVQGDLHCTATPTANVVNATDLLFFRRVMETKQFAIGEYQIGRAVNKPTIAVGYPILNSAGEVELIVAAGIDLRGLHTVSEGVSLPEGAVLNVFDNNGTILVRNPDAENLVGKQFPEAEIVQTLLAGPAIGTVSAEGVAGGERLWAYQTLVDDEESKVMLTIGVDEAVIFGPANAELQRNLLLLALVTLLVLWAARQVSQSMVLGGVERLVAACRRLGTGDFSARVEGKIPSGEIGQLMSTFNLVAAQLQTREETIRRVSRARKVLSLVNRNMVRATNETAMLKEVCRILVEEGGFAVAVVGLSDGTEKKSLRTVAKAGFDQGASERQPIVFGLHDSETSIGTISLFPKEAHLLDEDESQLLEEMAEDVSFGIASLRHGEERKRAEVAQRESEAQYRSYVSQSIDGVIVMADNGSILEVNPAAAQMLGYAPEQFAKMNVREFILANGEAEEVGLNFLVSLIREGKSGLDVSLRHADGHKVIADVRAVALGSNRNLVLVRDITERRMNEDRIKELNELRNKFIQIVSHQLRTPLNAISWNLESLMSEEVGKLKKTQKDFLRVTYESNKEVIRRIHDLLTALDIEEKRVMTQKELVSIESLWASVFSEAKKRCKSHGITCTYKAPKEPIPEIAIDAQKIREVFEKLIDNAVSYNTEGGSVTAELGMSVGGQLRFIVTDTGIGIPPSEQKRVFTPFYRATNASVLKPDASGLGLSIAKYYVEQHGGQIGFISQEGKGSSFWFKLPLA